MNDVLQQALEAIDDLEGEINGYRTSDFPIPEKAKRDIRQAIADLEKQKPVAWMRTKGTGSPVITEEFLKHRPEYRSDFEIPLYTHPQPKQPLTDEQISEVMKSIGWTGEAPSDREFARAIERAHGIGDKA